MKKSTIFSLLFASLLFVPVAGCGSSSSTGGYSRGVHHYHHGHPGWGRPYYGTDVIIIDDGIDIGPPDAVTLPIDDWD